MQKLLTCLASVAGLFSAAAPTSAQVCYQSVVESGLIGVKFGEQTRIQFSSKSQFPSAPKVALSINDINLGSSTVVDCRLTIKSVTPASADVEPDNGCYNLHKATYVASYGTPVSGVSPNACRQVEIGVADVKFGQPTHITFDHSFLSVPTVALSINDLYLSIGPKQKVNCRLVVKAVTPTGVDIEPDIGCNNLHKATYVASSSASIPAGAGKQTMVEVGTINVKFGQQTHISFNSNPPFPSAPNIVLAINDIDLTYEGNLDCRLTIKSVSATGADVEPDDGCVNLHKASYVATLTP